MATDVASLEAPPPTDGAADSQLLDDDADDPVLSIVMPTLDEEAGIAECIARAKRAIERVGVSAEILISDSSSDRTPAIARDHGAIVVTPDRPGYGYAYRYAFERARGDYVAIGDADTTYDFEELPRLLERLRERDADMVLGNRFAGEILPGAMPPLHRYVGNPLLTALLNTLYGTDVGDAHSGFRVVTAEALDRLDLGTDGMEFASEMIMAAGRRGLTVAEEPITYHPREGEATLDSFRDGWRHVEFMLRNAPGFLFALPGVALAALGVVVTCLAAVGVQFGGAALGPRAAVAGGVLSVVGAQVASLGLASTVGVAAPPGARSRLSRALRAGYRKHGTSVGLALFVGGSAYAAALVVRWTTTGFARPTVAAWDVAAVVAIGLGVQLVFSSCFVDVAAEHGAVSEEV